MTDQAVPSTKDLKVCEIRMPSDVRTEAVVKAFTELCHKYNLEAKIRGASQRGAPRTNPEGEIVIAFKDSAIKVPHKDDRKARKWLRKLGLSVTNATKAGNVWTFAVTPKAVTIAVTGKAKATVPPAVPAAKSEQAAPKK